MRLARLSYIMPMMSSHSMMHAISLCSIEYIGLARRDEVLGRRVLYDANIWLELA
jgi:hypothetical protein